MLVVDIDPQGNTTSGFGLAKTGNERTVYEVILKECDIRDAIIENVIDNLQKRLASINLLLRNMQIIQAYQINLKPVY